MNDAYQYDVAIIGGGLAGLALSIQLSRMQYRVALFEKEQYPFHKVCGEYISMESRDFIESLGLPVTTMDFPVINKLMVSSPNGNVMMSRLAPGGFGISRFMLDNALKEIAVTAGVTLFEKCRVEDVTFANDIFSLDTSLGNFSSRLCCGCFGKRSNLDIRWKRNFVLKKSNKLSNYVGIKYHIRTDWPADTIALHNFMNGYCGISKIEDDKYCLCYLTNALNLSLNNNSIQQVEQNVLFKNRHIKAIFENSEKVFLMPVTISQISFGKKSQVYDHILLLGDAAGMITPLCGNGMSMALHSSKIATAVIHDFFQQKITRETMENNYITAWNKTFGHRLKAGRILQRFFGGQWRTNIFLGVMKSVPPLTKQIIALTHGENF